MPAYGVSFQGKRHLQKGVPCQDCCGYTTTPNDWVVAVVADGVSASPNSEDGAAIAVDSCLDYFSELKYSPFFDADGIQLVLRDAFNYALRCIKESDKPGEYVPFSKMTTLQVLVFHKRIGLHWGQAGDGALIIRNAKGNWKRVTFAMKNKEDNDSPITLQDGPDAWQFGSLPVQGLDSFLLTTDGVADIIGDDNTDKKVRNAVIRFLMTPPSADLNKQETDMYYRSLFLGAIDSARLYNDATAKTAAARLSSITDDITVLLVSGLSSPEDNAIHGAKNSLVNQQAENPETELKDQNGSSDNVYPHLNNPSIQKSQNQFGQSQAYRRGRTETPYSPNEQTDYRPVIRRTPSRNDYAKFHRKNSLLDTILDKLFADKTRFVIILLIIIVLVFAINLLFGRTSDESKTNPQETNLESEIITTPMETTTPSSDDQALTSETPETTIPPETTDASGGSNNPEPIDNPDENETKRKDSEPQSPMDSDASSPDIDKKMEPGDDEQKPTEEKTLEDNDEESILSTTIGHFI